MRPGPRARRTKYFRWVFGQRNPLRCMLGSAPATDTGAFGEAPLTLPWVTWGATISQAVLLAVYGVIGLAAVVLAALGLVSAAVLGMGSRYFLPSAELAAFGALLLVALGASYVYCFRRVRAGRFREVRLPFALMAIGNTVGAFGGLAISSDLIFYFALTLAAAYLLLFLVVDRALRRPWATRMSRDPA